VGKPSVLITGTSGFVGNRLLERLQPNEFARICCLSRRVSNTMHRLAARPEVACYSTEIPGVPAPDEAFAGIDTVIHLAATTGKAAPATYTVVNADGTRALVQQCVRCGVRNLLFVSTIAARFADISRYYYAQSKRAAEAAVAASGLRYLIVRPTLVVGPGGGAWEGLLRLAKLPVTPVFGDGQTQIQPIQVDDLVDSLLTIVHEDLFTNDLVELGGPEPIRIEDFLRRIRQALGRRTGPLLHLPLGLCRRTLGLLEGFLRPLLPVTAGQLSTFSEDGTVQGNPLFQRLAPRMKRIDEMLALAISPRAA